jgi:ABC-2 type transport system ATP-binding protein
MITVESVTKQYGPHTAVDDVSFTAAPGRVTGFLGPNGAGKSTTMRVVVGLTPPTSGTAHVLGRRFVDLPNPGLEVGVLLDASAQHGGRTGREVLGLAAATMGLPRRRVEAMLALVGLTDAEAARRVRDYWPTTSSSSATAASWPRERRRSCWPPPERSCAAATRTSWPPP